MYIESVCPKNRKDVKVLCPVKFPVKSISCDDVHNKKYKKEQCKDYVLMGAPDSLDDKDSKKDSKKDSRKDKEIKHKKRTLYDFCPKQCSVKKEICSNSPGK